MISILDRYKELVHPLWVTTPRGVIRSIRPITPTASVVTIRTNRAWTGHRPGQFVTIGIDVDGVRHQRCYSITSTPDEPDLEIAVQRVADGTVSRHLTTDARPGDVVHLGAADGDFTLPLYTPDALLFVAGGSGITPIVGILRSLAVRPPQSDVVVIHHGRTTDTTMFAAELTTMAERHEWLTVHLVATRDGGSHLDADRLAAYCPDWAGRAAYVCGPTALLDFATDHWERHGALDHLHMERFGLAPLAPARADGHATASFTASGIATAAPTDRTLLETAEAAGIVAPYGCRSGVCHTCSTRLVDGCTTDVRDGRRNEAGTHVQLCVNVPDGDVALDL